MMFDNDGSGHLPDNLAGSVFGLLTGLSAEEASEKTRTVIVDLADSLQRSCGFRNETVDLAVRHYEAARGSEDEDAVATAAMEFLISTRHIEARFSREMRAGLVKAVEKLTGANPEKMLQRAQEVISKHPDVLALKDEHSDYDGALIDVNPEGDARVTPIIDGEAQHDEEFFISRSGERFDSDEELEASIAATPTPGEPTIEGIDLDAVIEPERNLNFEGLRDFDGKVE